MFSIIYFSCPNVKINFKIISHIEYSILIVIKIYLVLFGQIKTIFYNKYPSFATTSSRTSVLILSTSIGFKNYKIFFLVTFNSLD